MFYLNAICVIVGDVVLWLLADTARARAPPRQQHGRSRRIRHHPGGDQGQED